ncbi:hypothetical protein Fmac_027735 [Flemingia macrophylla]|uniref:SANTA domain-containing protein n=1 Tax=Flemingia macrophylla TaxID=520843 RepID=A0ABD1LIQ2_9FABA
MADSTPIATPSDDYESCSFRQTVSLYDWWLVKAKNDFQGKRLAVAGVSSGKNEAVRVFVSSAVIKRYDLFSLETADGKFVIIRGFINEQRTLENGFAPEVFNHFLFGFPPNWESYALDCFRKESTTVTDLGGAVPDNASASCPEISSGGVEKSIPTYLVSPEDPSGHHKKPFPENECNVSKEMGAVNVACSGGKRSRVRLPNIKLCQQKKQSASRGLPDYPNNEENSTSATLEGRKSLATPIQPQPWSEYSNDACVENYIPTSLVSPEESLRDHERPVSKNDCNVTNEMGGVNVACSNGGKRHSARLHNIKKQKKQPASGGPSNHPVVENSIPTSLASSTEASGDHKKSFPENGCNVSQEMGGVNVACSIGASKCDSSLHDIQVCQLRKRPVSGCLLNHPDNEENSTSVTLEGVEKSIPTSLVSPEDPPRHHKKPTPENECNVSKMGGVNVGCSSGGKRRSARLYDIQLCQQKNSTSVTLENCDVVGLESPATHIQSHSWRQLNTSSEQLVKKSASRVSKNLFPMSDSCYKKKRVTAETKPVRSMRKQAKFASDVKNLHEKDLSHLIRGSQQKITDETKLVRPMRKQIKSASAVKNQRKKDLSHLIRGSQHKISTVSPEFSFSKSKSGRLLLPPLEFWRNQIPIYNAAHEITEIQDGASMISPCRGSSPSLSRFNNRRRAA